MQIAFKVQNGINHMFQDFRPCQRTAFSNVANDKNRNVLAFGDLHQLRGNLSDLRHAPNRTVDIGCLHGLDRIDHHVFRIQIVNRCPNAVHTGLRVDVEVIAGYCQPFGTHFDLRTAFFARNIQDGMPFIAELARNLQ